MWEKFEDFIAELLPRLGFSDVKLCGADAPGLDIVAIERRRTILGQYQNIRWGVQIKRTRRRSTFGEIQKAIIEAAQTGTTDILWVSVKEVGDSVRKKTENYIEVAYPNLGLIVHYASERNLRRLVFEHHELLARYFDIGRDDIEAEVERLAGGAVDSYNVALIDTPVLAASIAVFGGEDGQVMTPTDQGVIQMRYETTIGRPINEELPSGLHRMTDRVTYIRIGELDALMSFEFTSYRPFFEESLRA